MLMLMRLLGWIRSCGIERNGARAPCSVEKNMKFYFFLVDLVWANALAAADFALSL